MYLDDNTFSTIKAWGRQSSSLKVIGKTPVKSFEN